MFSRKKSLIVHHGERGINTVHQAFPELVKKGAHIISTYHDVEKEMEKMERKYRAECLESRVDIRPAHDANNPEGRDLIRFFLEQPQVSESTYRRVSNFLSRSKEIISFTMWGLLFVTEQYKSHHFLYASLR